MNILVPLKIYPTDDYLFITIQKVATRLLGSMYPDDISRGLAFDYNFDIINKKIIPAKSDLDYLQQLVVNDFNDATSNNLKKKVIILYRNPLNRFKSGIVQDFNTSILDNENSYFTLKLLFQLLNADSETKSFVKKNIGSLQHADLKNSPDKIREFFKESLKHYTNYLSEIGFNNPHGVNYIYAFYILLTYGIFDLSNVILCDIDDNLNELISELNIDVNYEHKNSNSEFIPLVEYVLTHDDVLRDKVKKYLHTETLFYNILKNHPNNFKIEDTQI